MHVEPIGCLDALIEAQSGNAKYLRQRDLFFFFRAVLQPPVKLP